jgi:parvulin-like peptidyl-prolyl isomerase
MRRLLREPLLHFLLLGAALFAAYTFLQRGRGTEVTARRIELTQDDLGQLDVYFESQWRRPPTPQELDALVEQKVQEEILYREALALGLDKDDTIVKRRMAQKMQFLAEGTAEAHEPDPAELEAWYGEHAREFALPSRVSFRQLYFSPDRRGERARADAEQAQARLAREPEDSKRAQGDRIMLLDYYADRAPDQLAKEFGPAFARAIFDVKPGAWQGPIASGYGWHLVFVDSLVPGRTPEFAEVESDVKTAWLAEQKAQAWQKAYAEMRAKYTVALPAPELATR